MGTLAHTVLDYLRAHEPELYATAEYHLLDISESLSKAQAERLAASEHAARVRFHRASIFDWERVEKRPCFFLAFEVLVGRSASQLTLQTFSTA